MINGAGLSGHNRFDISKAINGAGFMSGGNRLDGPKTINGDGLGVLLDRFVTIRAGAERVGKSGIAEAACGLDRFRWRCFCCGCYWLRLLFLPPIKLS